MSTALCSSIRIALGLAVVALGLLGPGLAAAAQITLFNEAGFGGARLDLRGDAPDIRRAGFNDLTSSVVVTSGRWELCTDVGFGGTCTALEPGEYPRLDPRLANRISSARVLADDRAGPPSRGDGRYGHDEGRPIGPAGMPPVLARAGDRHAVLTGVRAVLFEEPGLRGRSITLFGADPDILRGRNASLGASSVVIEGGPWLLCADPSFNGNCIELNPGRYDDLAQAGLARRVLSARPVGMSAARGDWDGRPGWHGGMGGNERAGYGHAAVELFSQPDFAGQRYSADGDVQALRDFNDRAASAIVNDGQWEFCGDFDYRGGCAIYGPGRYPALGALTKHLSSVRRVR